MGMFAMIDPNAIRPTIVVDSREQCPLIFRNLPAQRGTLDTGDYSFVGAEHLFAVERKTLDDLAACCKSDQRDRFERELHRLRGFRWRHLIVLSTLEDAANGAYVSKLNPKSLLHTLRAFEARYELMVTWEPDPDRAAVLVEQWVYWSARELMRAAGEIEKSMNVPLHAA